MQCLAGMCIAASGAVIGLLSMDLAAHYLVHGAVQGLTLRYSALLERCISL